MRKALQAKIKAIQDQGLKRVITIFKLCMKEIPELTQQIESKDPAVQKKALLEARWMLQMLDNEIENARKHAQMRVPEFNAELNNPAHFSAEEWKLFMKVPELLRKYQPLLAAVAKEKKPKRRRPLNFPKV